MSGRIPHGMDASTEPQPDREMRDLELALLRRGMTERTARQQACGRCCRVPLIGERVYLMDAGVILCELCRPREVDPTGRSTLVHGPEFGHTLRLRQRQAA